MNFDPHVAFIFADSESLGVLDEPIADPLHKIFTSSNPNVEARFRAAHSLSSPMFKTSRDVNAPADAAPPRSEWDASIPSSTVLEKRAAGAELSSYRDWFRCELAKGKTAREALDKYLKQYPNAAPAVVESLRDIACEF